jgi:hypothetical protein
VVEGCATIAAIECEREGASSAVNATIVARSSTALNFVRALGMTGWGDAHLWRMGTLDLPYGQGIGLDVVVLSRALWFQCHTCDAFLLRLLFWYSVR